MNEHHLSLLVHKQAEKYGDRDALYYHDDEKSKWVPVSWNQFSRKIKETANALADIGVEEAENIGIFSQNMPECLYVDFADFDNHAVTVPLYATISAATTQYIVNDTKIRFLFVGEQYQYDAAFSVISFCPTLEKLIIFDKNVKRNPNDHISVYFDEFIALGKDLQHQQLIDERISHASDDDLANILYTSGTTGEPKGVMLLHSNYLEAFRIHDIRLEEMSDEDTTLNFLPLVHVFERAWVYYCIYKGVSIYINLRPTEIQKSLKEVRPTLMCSVPRFWEKVYIGVQEEIASASRIMRKIMLDALETGRIHNIEYVSKGLKAPLVNELKYQLYEKTVYRLLKKTIGIDRGNFFPTAGAAVPDKVCEFVHAVGINMLVGYGLTESTATVSCEWKTGYVVGSVGVPMPGVEVKIGDDNEILLRGKTIIKGYYKKPEATAEVIDSDGWFHTGDAGYLHGNHLYLTERIKDLFKTSNGKYVVPQALESQLTIDRYIDQIAIIADKRKYVSALIVPNYKLIEKFAVDKHIVYADPAELLYNDQVHELYQERIDTLQQKFAHYEQIKRFTLLPKPFSIDRNELTSTLKLKRSVIAQNYKEDIENMYQE